MDPGSPLSPEDPIPLDNILIQDLYAKIGHEFPHRLFARIVTDSGEQSILEEITWERLLHDSMNAASSLVGFGVPKRDKSMPQTVLAVLAVSSYRYYTYLVGAWLNGWTPLLLSTRNSLPAIHHLLSSVKAQAILLDETTRHMHKELAHLVPDLVIMKMGHSNDHVFELPETLSRQEVTGFDEVAIYMHTSGSQGHPKPVPTTHRQLVTGIKVRSGKKYAGSPAYAPLPLFHGIGIYAVTRWPIGSGLVPTFVNTKKPLNGEAVLEHLRHLPRAVAFLSPSILEDIVDAGNADLLARSGVQHVFYGGAPLKESTGNLLVSKGVSIVNAYGMTEISLITVLDHPSEDNMRDWSYVRFREGLYDYNFLPVEASAACELVVGPGKMYPSILNHDLGFATNDLWAPHPNIKGLWKHMGRKDGVTVLSTGEKTDNGQLASLLTQDPRIAHVVIFGSGKPLNGVIVSPSQIGTSFIGEFEPDSFRESIWDTVVKVNNIVPKHSRLITPMVLVEKPSKRFLTSDKGTVRPRETLALYEAEIAAAFSALEAGSEVAGDLPATFDQEQVRNMVRNIVEKICERPVGDETDIFDAGADSLHALQIRSAFVSFIKITDSKLVVPHNIAYTYPTVNQLVAFALDCMHGTRSQAVLKDNKQTRVEDCIRRFSDGALELERQTKGIVVLLTGSTGRLGCHVLDHLLCRPDIDSIYCLVRGEASILRQEVAFRDRGFPTARLSEDRIKVTIYGADFSKPDLALDADSLDMLRREVTHVFHLAWELNFNWPLERFEKSHIAGVRHLIDLVRSSTRSRPPKLIFASSIGAVQNYTASHQIPEQAFYNPLVSTEGGYGEAKYVSEQLIDSASKALGFSATIIRCGQLSGSIADGAWARTEFIPLMFKSSLSLGLFPETMPAVRWLPVDVVAQCFTDLALHETNGLTYYHIENTESTPWSEITQMFIAVANSPVKIVPTKEWLAAVEEVGSMSDKSSISSAPAAFLLEFYSGLTEAHNRWRTLDTSISSQVAPRMRYGRMTLDLMQKYVRWVADS